MFDDLTMSIEHNWWNHIFSALLNDVKCVIFPCAAYVQQFRFPCKNDQDLLTHHSIKIYSTILITNEACYNHHTVTMLANNHVKRPT